MIIRFLGYLFSAAALTVLLGGALVVGAFIYHSRDLPPTEQLADYKPPQSSLVLNDDGGVIARFAREERVFIPIGDIPEVVRHAFISAEDKNFYEHRGIDPIGIGKAMVRNVDAFLNGNAALPAKFEKLFWHYRLSAIWTRIAFSNSISIRSISARDPMASVLRRALILISRWNT